VLGGVSSFGAGLIVTTFLMPIIGVEEVVPVMSVATTFGNLSRFWAYRAKVDCGVVLTLMIPALPAVIFGTLFYGLLPQRELAVGIGAFLLASIPLRRILAKWAVTPAPTTVIGYSGVSGLMSGAFPGGGLLEAGGDASELLELGEAALDEVALWILVLRSPRERPRARSSEPLFSLPQHADGRGQSSNRQSGTRSPDRPAMLQRCATRHPWRSID
jgi:hypothetical protein